MSAGGARLEPLESLQSHKTQTTHRPRCTTCLRSGHTVVPVGLTGIIYALVVLAWAAYLLPQALRRHDVAARKHSIERFSSAMRVLARRGSSRSDRFVVAPARTVDRVLTPSLATRPTVGASPTQRKRPGRAALKAAATRRRRVLIVLSGLTVATAVVGLLGLLPRLTTLVPLALVVGFLVLARHQVRRQSEDYWVEVSEDQAEPSNVVRRPATRVDASHGAAKAGSGASRVAATSEDPADDEPTITLDREALRQARVDVGVVTTADGVSLWDPLPVTLPTYVDKPMAARTYRTVDLAEPGTWSSGHSEKDSRNAAAGATRASAPQSSDAPVDDQPHAVNG